MDRANMDIRQYAQKKGVYLWEIAQAIGCNDGNLSRKLRTELPESEKKRYRNIIDNISKSHRESH